MASHTRIKRTAKSEVGKLAAVVAMLKDFLE
jgi:hypothetical protein